MTREICKACNRINPLGFDVPDEVWNASAPEHLRESVLCISCFDYYATENNVDWSGKATFFPASGVMHRKD